MGLPKTASPPAQPYRNPYYPGEHAGIVTLASGSPGSTTVDLAIGHNDFVVKSIVQFGTTVATNDACWSYGTRPGTFVIKSTALATKQVAFAVSEIRY